MATKKALQKKQDKTIAWDAFEYEYIEKTSDWYWIVGSLGFLIAAGSYIIGNWTFAILITLSTLMFMFMARRKPHMIHVTINHKTLTLNEKTYQLKKFDTYNIDTDRSKLLLHSSGTYRPLTVVPMPSQAPTSKITTLLEDDLELELNEELREPLLEVLLHQWGF